MVSIIHAISFAILGCFVAVTPVSQKVTDPYPGSGGLMLGTPSEKDIESGKIDFTTKRFDSLKIGISTKVEVVKILGKPIAWRSSTDGKSQLEYDYINKEKILGMRQIMHTFFTFNSAMVLTRITYPGYDSKVVPITFNGVPYVGTDAGDEYIFTPKENIQGMFDTELLIISVIPMNKPGRSSSLETVISNAIEGFTRNGQILDQSTEVASYHRVCAVLDKTNIFPNYSEFVLARFQQIGSVVVGIRYSRRIRGKASMPQLDSWIKQNRAGIEKQIANFDLSTINGLLEE